MTIINMPKSTRWQLFVFVCLQIILAILYIVFVRYGDESSDIDAQHVEKYPMFQDVHVMIFVGFGFLMTFLRRYGYSAVGFNLLTAAFLIQWAVLCNGFYEMDSNWRIRVGITSLMGADVAVAAVLISMGVVLGKTTYMQLILMGFIEVALYASNKYMCIQLFKVIDAGESMFVHVFGAYFGLAVSFAMRPKAESAGTDNNLEGASYTSDLFSMIGTVFLWMYWPSFNAGGLSGDEQHRAVVNTYLSLAACCVGAFITSAMVSPERKFAMEHVQNATLAGGVAVGTVANLMVQPYGALIIGYAAGTLSVVGFHYVQPWILNHLRVHDTCGVNNLHGMPGVFAGLLGVLMSGIASEETYGTAKIYEIWPARGPPSNSAYAMLNFKPENGGQSPNDIHSRTASEQALYQLIALAVTLAIALVTGYITGFLLNNSGTRLAPEYKFDDGYNWNVPEISDSPAKKPNGTTTEETADSRV